MKVSRLINQVSDYKTKQALRALFDQLKSDLNANQTAIGNIKDDLVANQAAFVGHDHDGMADQAPIGSDGAAVTFNTTDDTFVQNLE